MLDVISFGEALVDLPATAPGSLEEAPAFEKVPAGAPANVAVSKHENGWNGFRFTSARVTAAFRNPRSNAAL